MNIVKHAAYENLSNIEKMLVGLAIEKSIQPTQRIISALGNAGAAYNAVRGGSFLKSLGIGAGAGLVNHIINPILPLSTWRHALMQAAVELPGAAVSHGIGRLFYRPKAPNTLKENIMKLIKKRRS